jgi:hypothetical protein
VLSAELLAKLGRSMGSIPEKIACLETAVIVGIIA